MRITLEISATTHRRIKARAALSGRSAEQLILRSIEQSVKPKSVPKKKGRRVTLPLIDSKNPGWLKLTNKQINQNLVS